MINSLLPATADMVDCLTTKNERIFEITREGKKDKTQVLFVRVRFKEELKRKNQEWRHSSSFK